MKNICFVCYNLSVMGGTEKVITEITSTLCDYYNIHVISLYGDEPFFKLDKRIKYTYLNIQNKRLRKAIIPVTIALKNYYKLNNIDISFISENYAGFLASFTSLFTKTSHIFWEHGPLMGQWERRDIRTLKKTASKLCDYTLTLTEESMQDNVRKFHLNPKRVFYIHNWIEPMKMPVSYDINNHLIISAGRFSYEKEFHSILPQIAKLVKQRHPDWQWHIYGDGELMEETSKKIKELNLENFLILKGKVNDLEQRYKDYGMCVMTSSREGMPLVLLEAKANGLPIVAFDVKTGPKEIVNDEKDGLLIPDMDVNKMADAICRLIEHPDLREQMSNHALSTVDAFSKETILKQWIDFIESI